MANATIRAEEAAHFGRLAADWWDPKGSSAMLHRLNPVRLGFIRDAIDTHWGEDSRGVRPLSGRKALDVGCGAGLLCEPLARLGATVTGIDPAPTNVEVAKLHCAESGVPVTYRQATIEQLVAEGQSFDIVLAMEVVEHVADVDAFVRACTAAVKPGGLLFMATLNRTMKAFALAIVGAEYILGWLPKGTHQWDKFVTPKELADAIARGGLEVFDEKGVVYNPLSDKWSLSRDRDVNYMVVAK